MDTLIYIPFFALRPLFSVLLKKHEYYIIYENRRQQFLSVSQGCILPAVSFKYIYNHKLKVVIIKIVSVLYLFSDIKRRQKK